MLVLTTFEDDEILAGALRAGAAGFLLKGVPAEDLQRAVRAVAAGDSWLDPAVTGRVLTAYRDGAPAPAAARRARRAHPARARGARAASAPGCSNGEIAAELVLGEGTVKTHVGHVFAKLGLRDRAAAVVFAFDAGLVVRVPRCVGADRLRVRRSLRRIAPARRRRGTMARACTSTAASSFPSASSPSTRRPPAPRGSFRFPTCSLPTRSEPMDLHGAFHVYDTTLRDGAQQEGLNLSVADKLAIARQLDGLGVGYIEGGWPGANPKDTEFFRRAVDELHLKHAGSRRSVPPARPGSRAADDPQVAALRDSGAGVVTLVAKSHDRHVELALRTTLEENLAMVRDTVSHLRAEGQQVFLDAEHFFDGYRANRDYALEVLRTAHEAGAEVVALCDTNGGMLPTWVSDVVHDVIDTTGVRVGIHAHNDSGCAVANSLAAIDAGATHVQGCINGYGERTGNADLVTVVANLELKKERPVLPEGLLAESSRIAHAVAEVTNVPPYSRQPYVGGSAFAHKAGLHASAIKVDPDLYQHTQPERVGNDMRLLVSDMAGRASIELKGRELGYDLSEDRDLVTRLTGRVKTMEQRGYTFEAADASFELLLVEEADVRPTYFEVESWRVITETLAHRAEAEEAVSEATVKLKAAGVRYVVTGEGNGPVNALDSALREAIGQAFPEVAKFELIDYKVRILDQGHGTDAITRVLIETTDGETSWVTVGVGHNVIEASWEALVDGLTYGLRRHAEA